MKTWMLLAALALLPGAISAQTVTGGHAQIPVDEGARAELLKDIEATRAALLPDNAVAQPFNARYAPRLADLKNTAAAAKTSVDLAKVKKDFADWKAVVLKAQFAEKQKAAPGVETYAAFSARKAQEIEFVSSLQQQFALQRAKAQTLAVEAVVDASGDAPNAAAWNRVFDNNNSSFFNAASNDGAVRVPDALPAGDPARYNKIRSLLLSQGVSKQIIDTAIAEGIRQKVDPMIVLSVINQESNFRKNAYNRGSGCTGLMQLDPATAADMGVRGNLYDPAANIKAGTKYLNWIANSFFKMGQDLSDMSKIPADKLKMILASYNWGIGNVQKTVRKHGVAALDRVAPRETRNYIAEIPSRIYDWFASF